MDLIDEMEKEIEKGNLDEVKDLAANIRGNEEKIIFHGKRADGIVKSMLQHSRNSNNTKEFTDINSLCDEYLRLAFHGMRAKDKTFNSGMETSFDENAEKINIVPQDIGRVLLNLLTNAFYEVNEKRKTETAEYKPMVKISTRQSGNHIQIEVSDNGRGIPDDIKKKIFQPFFTTKPTGKGTGLGLSLSYDIITKEHNGEIIIDSVPGKFTIFKIILPLNQK
jgi:signal transduction histidine kinase